MRSQKAKASVDVNLVHRPDHVVQISQRLADCPIIAFDTEFIRERTFFPQLGLIQVADREKAWLIDPLALSPAELEPLLDVFTDPKILKVAHASEQDQECLYHAYGRVAAPVLDTSIAAALTGRGDQIGLSALLEKTLGLHIPKTHSRTDWLKRPLPQAMAAYALADVEHLVEAAELLLQDLDRRRRRDWALRLSAKFTDPRRFEPNPEGLAQRLAAARRFSAVDYAVLRELVEWRERQVRRSNLPRRWLADDSLLVKLAHAHPNQLEDLTHFRGLGTKTLENGGGEILQAIRRGVQTPPDQLPSPPKRNQSSPEENTALSVLRCFLNQLAQEHEIPPRFLVDPDHLPELLRKRFKNPDELQRSGLIDDCAAGWFAAELWAVLEGKRVLKLIGGRVKRESL